MRKHTIIFFIAVLTAANSLAWAVWAGQPVVDPSAQPGGVTRLFREVSRELDAPRDRAALEQICAVFSRTDPATQAPTTEWMVLSFNQHGVLEAVRVQADVLLAAPPLIQRAVILHEVEHVKRAPETARRLSRSSDRGPSEDRFRRVIRAVVDDECRAYRRDILYVFRAVQAHGGLPAYLQTLPPTHRLSMQRYYRQAVEPFLAPNGTVNERRLRRDGIFFGTFPHQYPRYYEAALAWEALHGHVEIRRGSDGILRPTRFLTPTVFLAWLSP